MLATPAQIEATEHNTPTAPDQVKTRSRADSLKQGMAGVAVVLPARDAAEVERLAGSFRSELKPEGDVGEVLVRRMAVHAVRMDRAVVQETAAISARVREAIEGCRTFYMSDEEVQQRRAEVGNRALFDDSREGILARKYEAASERAFHRSLKELRRMRAEAERASVEELKGPEAIAEAPAPSEKLASFFPDPPAPEEADPKRKVTPAVHRDLTLTSALLGWETGLEIHYDIPIAMGRAR